MVVIGENSDSNTLTDSKGFFDQHQNLKEFLNSVQKSNNNLNIVIK